MATLNENLQTIQLFVCLLLVASLWENPRDGRSPRQRRGGIFHRLRADLSYLCFLAYGRISIYLVRSGAPLWLSVVLQFLFHLLPATDRREACRKYLDRGSEGKSVQP